MHRSSAADNSSSSNHRSHSQPARQSVSLTLSAQIAPPLPLNSNAFLQYQHLRQQQLCNVLENAQGRYGATDLPMYQDPRRTSVDQQYEESMPKEYMGYWVNDSPSMRHHPEDPNQRLPTFQDLHARVRGVPQTSNRLRNASRSPSPSPAIPFRDRSFSIRSASSALLYQYSHVTIGFSPPYQVHIPQVQSSSMELMDGRCLITLCQRAPPIPRL